MPQLQILNRQPGFGEELGAALGGGVSQGISGQLSQMLEQKQQQAKTKSLFDALGISPNILSDLQPKSLEPSAQKPSRGKLGRLTQDQVLAASLINPAIAPALGSIYKNQQKEKQVEESHEIAQSSFDRASDILSSKKIGLKIPFSGAGPLDEESAEARGEFDTLMGALESELKDRVSRGTLSNSRFEYITKTLLPKSTDREATIRGKLKGLARELDLNLPDTLEEKKGLRKVEKGTKLTPSKAQEILNKSGNDPKKARELAAKLGYEF